MLVIDTIRNKLEEHRYQSALRRIDEESRTSRESGIYPHKSFLFYPVGVDFLTNATTYRRHDGNCSVTKRFYEALSRTAATYQRKVSEAGIPEAPSWACFANSGQERALSDWQKRYGGKTSEILKQMAEEDPDTAVVLQEFDYKI